MRATKKKSRIRSCSYRNGVFAEFSTHVPVDLTDPEVLKLNHFLLGRASANIAPVLVSGQDLPLLENLLLEKMEVCASFGEPFLVSMDKGVCASFNRTSEMVH